MSVYDDRLTKVRGALTDAVQLATKLEQELVIARKQVEQLTVREQELRNLISLMAKEDLTERADAAVEKK